MSDHAGDRAEPEILDLSRGDGPPDDGPADGGARSKGVPPPQADAPPPHADPPEPKDDAPGWLRLGRYAWATLGIIGLLVVLALVVGELMVLAVPIVLALFPAALLMPLTNLLRRFLPDAVAAILTILVAIGVIGGVGTALAPVFAEEIPAVVDSFQQGLQSIDDFLAEDHLGLGVTDLSDVADRAREAITQGGGAATGALNAATVLIEGVTGFLLLIVALFFYLKDGARLSVGIVKTLPQVWQSHASEIGGRVWYTTGAYFRGQLLVALGDAVLIGIGLRLLGIPLALPLAVLIFFGGLFPIVGAVVTGFVAVLVALADAGLMRALAVLLLVLAVQQFESNVTEPFILSRAIRLHPLVVISAITAGGMLLGVLGAFLAVPIAASAARAIDYLRLGADDQGEAAQASSSDVEAYTEASSST
jgi:predicted PurR-regulated permease PerM